jgi:hypothetical protein
MFTRAHDAYISKCFIYLSNKVGNVYKHGPITGPIDYEWEARAVPQRQPSSGQVQSRQVQSGSHSTSRSTAPAKSKKPKEPKVAVRSCRCGAVIHALLPACAACVGVVGSQSSRGGGRVGGASDADTDRLSEYVSRLSVNDRKRGNRR